MSIQKEYVRSMKLAAKLMLKGFRIISVEPDKNNIGYDVYVFKKTPELTEAILTYINNSKNGGKYGSNNSRSNNKTSCSTF